MPSPDREAVLAIFERHRAASGVPFDESHFLDYLLAQPKRKGAVHNGFTGLRRYNAFIEEVQLHFGICFSVQDFEATYSLEKFLQRIAELRGSKRASIASFRNQQKRGFGWGTVFVGNFLALIAFVGSQGLSQLLAVSVATLWLASDVAALRFYLRWRLYNERLMNQLQSEVARDI